MKIKVIGTIGLLVLALVGCGDTVITEVNSGDKRFNGINVDYITIVTDSTTGCKYIYVEDGMADHKTTAMSPLMNADGLANCSTQ